jgi:hypothetical protein
LRLLLHVLVLRRHISAVRNQDMDDEQHDDAAARDEHASRPERNGGAIGWGKRDMNPWSHRDLSQSSVTGNAEAAVRREHAAHGCRSIRSMRIATIA